MHSIQCALGKLAWQLRCSVFAGALLGALLAVGSTAWANETLRVGKAVPQAFSFALLDVGIQQKLFGAEGINVESIGMGGGPKVIQATTADSLDIGLDQVPIWRRSSKARQSSA